jgi:hypothetical protein
MTIADEIREKNTFEHVKGLIENGLSPQIIAKSFEMPIEKVEEIIRKIKANDN